MWSGLSTGVLKHSTASLTGDAFVKIILTERISEMKTSLCSNLSENNIIKHCTGTYNMLFSHLMQLLLKFYWF
jgi:hypothetical protein